MFSISTKFVENLNISGICFLLGALLSAYFIPEVAYKKSAWYENMINLKSKSENLDELTLNVSMKLINRLLDINKKLIKFFDDSNLIVDIHSGDVKCQNDLLLTMNFSNFMDEQSRLGERNLINLLLDKHDEKAYKHHIYRGEHWGESKFGHYRFSLTYWENNERRFIEKLLAIKAASLYNEMNKKKQDVIFNEDSKDLIKSSSSSSSSFLAAEACSILKHVNREPSSTNRKRMIRSNKTTSSKKELQEKDTSATTSFPTFSTNEGVSEAIEKDVDRVNSLIITDKTQQQKKIKRKRKEETIEVVSEFERRISKRNRKSSK